MYYVIKYFSEQKGEFDQKKQILQSREIFCQPEGKRKLWRILFKCLEVVQLQPDTLKTSELLWSSRVKSAWSVWSLR